MSGFRPFVRQLGAQPGVQLNPIRDQTDGVAPDNSDQIVAVIARLTRGPLTPFRVNRSNFLEKTGPGESIRVNALNEAKLQVYEALENGAYEAVIQRLVPSGYVKSYAIVNFSGTPSGSAETVAYSTSPTVPSAAFSMYVMDHECYNDGIKLSLHADATPLGGSPVANKLVTLQVMDAKGVLRYEFSGSLDSAAKDDFGNSLYLPDVAAKVSNSMIDIVVAANASVPTTSNAYGRSALGRDNWATSAALVCFAEGGTSYINDDYDRAIAGLRTTLHPFGYLMSGGSQNLSLLGKLGSLASEINTHCEIDVPGNLSPAAAIAFVQSLNFDTHYIRYNWAPLEAEDPMNGGRAVWGTGGYHLGLSCLRNARVNAKGFAPKNYPVAGKDWPLQRRAVRQLVNPEEQELSDLAKSQINPVKHEVYNGGASFVWTDSLTAARTQVSGRMLQNIAEMSSSMDNWVALAAKGWTQLPMKTFIKNMTAFMDRVLQDAQASDWLVPAASLPGGAAYAFEVKRSTVRPADTVHIEYYPSYDGVARRVVIQQTLVN
jgi:hypothetical protein